MAIRSDRPAPLRATHPGEILREELRERGIKQKEFARLIGVQPTHLNEFIKGKRNLNDDLAIRLEKYLHIPYKLWMSLHSGYLYDCKAISAREDDQIHAGECESDWSEHFNLHILYQRLDLLDLPCEVRVKRLASLLHEAHISVKRLEEGTAGLYKHSEKVQIDDRNMLTWLILNQLSISALPDDLPPYCHGNALRASEEIAEMANAQTITAEDIKQCLNAYGIAYLVVEKVDKAPVDAYSTIAEGHPVITATYRYNDLDKLVFDILHELCHIDYHLSEDQDAFISIDGVEYSKDPREREANEYAQNLLIPDETWRSIMRSGCTSLNPHRIISKIASEASGRGISPTIAVARYKREAKWYKTKSYRSPRIL